MNAKNLPEDTGARILSEPAENTRLNANENIPAWLLENPTESTRPPVQSRIQELPFEELTWKNFERLSLRLVAKTMRVEGCRLYGNEGEGQEGIDIFARCSHTSKYLVYQCKREKDFGPAKIRAAVDAFTTGEWFIKSSTFTLCTQESLQGIQRADTLEELADMLRRHDIVLKSWDAPQLNILLKDHPEIVADFFGPAWRDAFCGTGHLEFDRNREEARKFIKWASTVTSNFEVPGLGITLAISDAWIRLRCMQDSKDRGESGRSFKNAIENYHEWLRLGDASSVENISTDDLESARTNCVVIGGPGSGKSTLCKRLANQWLNRGRLVLLVRLKRVNDLVSAGHTFTDALSLQATDGSGLTTIQRQKVLEEATVLIADGLDECDPYRSETARSLTSWAAGHPNARLLVTTRPVGHHPNLLPDFTSVELLPLDETSVASHSERLFTAGIKDGKEALRKWSAFIRELSGDKRTAKTLASRNPLLLGFMVRLSIDDILIGTDRSALFSQILQLMAVNPSSKRPPLAPETAHEVINAIAFNLISDPANTIDELASSLMHDYQLNAQTVRDAVSYWESCRAIERVSAGHLSGIVFVHPSLGEFCAARHVLTFDGVALSNWLQFAVRVPRWRQVMLLATQVDARVLPQLLAQSNLTDPCSIEAIIAAEAISESRSLQVYTEDVYRALLGRITSENPFLSIESAMALQPLFRSLPTVVIDKSLLDHPNEWTRLAALSLLIHYKDPEVIEHFGEWLQSFTYVSGFRIGSWQKLHDSVLPNEAGGLQHEIIKTGLPHWIAAHSENDIERYFSEGRDLTGVLSIGMIESLGEILRSRGLARVAELPSLNIEYRGLDMNFESMNGEPALIDALIKATGLRIDPLATSGGSMYWIQSIIGAIEIGQTPASHGAYLKRRIKFEEVVEVLRGTITAVGANLQELAHELGFALSQIAQSGGHISIYGKSMVKQPDWELAVGSGLDIDLLEKALEHPHRAIRDGAALLLYGGAAGGRLAMIVDRTLEAGGFESVRLASLLFQQAYLNDFIQEALRRLRAGIRPGMEYLIQKVFETAGDEILVSIRDEIGAWLTYPEPHFAAHVAEVIRPIVANRSLDLSAALYNAFEVWGSLGTWCSDHGIRTQGVSCPKCNLCIPSPRAELLRTLADANLFRSEDLLPFLSVENSDIAKAGTEKVLGMAREDANVVAQILTGITAETVPARLLTDLSQLTGVVLRPNCGAFVTLLRNSNKNVVQLALSSLTGDWMQRDDAVQLASSFLDSEDSSMVIAATRILRILREQ